MLTYTNESDAAIISEMIAHGEQTFGAEVFWTKEGMLGPLIRRAMSMAHIKVEVTVSSSYRYNEPDKGNVGLPNEINFQWYKDNKRPFDPTDPLYMKDWRAWADYAPAWERYLVGGWINHGTDLQPNWGSHT